MARFCRAWQRCRRLARNNSKESLMWLRAITQPEWRTSAQSCWRWIETSTLIRHSAFHTSSSSTAWIISKRCLSHGTGPSKKCNISTLALGNFNSCRMKSFTISGRLLMSFTSLSLGLCRLKPLLRSASKISFPWLFKNGSKIWSINKLSWKLMCTVLMRFSAFKRFWNNTANRAMIEMCFRTSRACSASEP